jgi:multiple sugar transport system substrate-binding protein
MYGKHRPKLHSSMSRRRLLGTAGVGGGLLAAGLHGALRPAGAALPATQDQVTVTFWTPGGSPAYCEVHAEIAADYTAENPSTVIDFQCGTGQEQFMERFLGSIAAGNPPEATVLWDSPVSLGVRGSLLPIDELMANSQFSQVENWPAGVLQSCQFGGRTFGLPVAAPSYSMWYNQDLFDAKGIPSDRASFPKTWDELRALSKEFTEWDGDRLVTAGFVPWYDENTLPIWSALNGGQIYDGANQRYTIDAEPNVEMMEFVIAWLDEEYRGDINLVERAGAWAGYPSDDGLPPRFQMGQLAMMEWGSWGMGDFYAYGDVAFNNWGVAPYPVGPSGTEPVSGYWPNWLAIPNGTDYPEEAFGYLDYLSGVGIAKWFSVIPDLPANSQVPEVVPEVALEHRDQEIAEDVTAFFRAQLEVATPMWDSPVQSFAIDQLDTALEQIMTKSASPSDALAAAQQACQAELESVVSSVG